VVDPERIFDPFFTDQGRRLAFKRARDLGWSILLWELWRGMAAEIFAGINEGDLRRGGARSWCGLALRRRKLCCGGGP